MIISIGQHKVKNGSITAGIADLMGEEKADIINTDPPWGQGNVNYWQTINKRHTGKERETIDFKDFLSMCFDCYNRYAKNLLFLAYGQRWREEILERGRSAGFISNAVIRVGYKSGSKVLPFDFHVFSRIPVLLTPQYIKSVEDTIAYDTLQAAIKPFARAGMIILDPMCGLGYTAKLAVETGMIFRGNELNRKRLDHTIKRLQQ